MSASRNVALYPWFRFFQNLLFWQAIWFLFLQAELSAAEALLLYAVYDIATTALEVPSGWMSDRFGRRKTLIFSAIMGALSTLLFVVGDAFWVFALAQAAMGAHIAFASGTDSAFLYESLSEADRAGDVETEELRAWRFTFGALAASGVTGGAMALLDMRLPFAANFIAFAVLILICLRFQEPAHPKRRFLSEMARVRQVFTALQQPVLVWLFAMAVLIYGFGHALFVYGQPFILTALDGYGLSTQAPFVSGAVTTLLMAFSVLMAWIAPRIKSSIGLGPMLLFAFAIQLVMVFGMTVSMNIAVIALLLLRKVPDAMSLPFIQARTQPLLSDDIRATYLSVRSFVARLLFALSLFAGSMVASDIGQMASQEVSVILAGHMVLGVLALVVLWSTSRRMAL